MGDEREDDRHLKSIGSVHRQSNILCTGHIKHPMVTAQHNDLFFESRLHD